MRTVLSTFTLLFLGASFLAADELRTLKEGNFTGKAKKVTAEEVIFVDEKEGEIKFPVKEILYLKVGGKSANLAGIQYTNIELRDGSLLHCKNYEIKKDQAKLTLINDKVLELPLSAITSLLHEAHNSINMKEWKERVLSKKKFRDILAVRRNGVVNALEGTLGDADAEGKTIHFKLGATTEADVPFSRAFGLYWIRKPDPAWKPVICKVLDSHSNLFYAHNVVNTPAGYTIETPAGVKLELKTEQLVNLDYSRGKLVFLSDLNPVDEVRTRVAAWKDSYKRDTNLAGGRIRLEGRIYDRGLAIHSHTELEFDLGGEYRELKAVAGIDDNVTGSTDPVVLKILCDGKELKSLTFSRKEGARPQSIVIPVKDVQRLRIIVTRGTTDNPLSGYLDTGKHLNLADIRVLK